MHGVQILDRADGALVASCAQEHWGRQIPASTIYSEGADERTGAQWTHESSSVDASECCSCQRVGLKFQGTHEPAGTKQGDCLAAHAHARWAHGFRLAKAHVDALVLLLTGGPGPTLHACSEALRGGEEALVQNIAYFGQAPLAVQPEAYFPKPGPS